MTAEPLEIHLDEQDLARALREDVRAGLGGEPKSLPPKYFYDARGSELFEEITRLPEYYPTRAERGILAGHADDVARVTGADVLVELGSGSSEKTRLLLDAFTRRGGLRAFVPLDVSRSALESSTAAVAGAYPDLLVRGVVGDFTRHLKRLPAGGRRLVAFLGGTIGNLVPGERSAFLGALREALEPGEWLLLGTDLVKDESLLVPAYDDAAGVTADFNRNVLRVVNRELGADFDVDAYDHVAVWNADEEWIEMRLRARRPMTVRVLGHTYTFAAGEDLLTEVSAKFRRARVEAELSEAGFDLRHWWTDGLFALSLSRTV